MNKNQSVKKRYKTWRKVKYTLIQTYAHTNEEHVHHIYTTKICSLNANPALGDKRWLYSQARIKEI